MSKATKNKKKTHIKKSQEIVLKQPSLFRKIVSFITAYSMMFLNITPVFATDITGIQGNNGVYDIDAAKVSGSTGFRQYKDFTLDNGDVANLKFDQGYNKFVRLILTASLTRLKVIIFIMVMLFLCHRTELWSVHPVF